MDYVGKLTEAFNFTWRYKSLWVLGFLIALFSGGMGNNFNGNFNSGFNNSSTNNDEYSAEAEKIADSISDPLVLVGAVILIMIFLVIALVGWYLASRAKAGLVWSVKEDAAGAKPTLGKAWSHGGGYVFRYIVMDLISVLITFVVMAPVIFLFIIASLLGPVGVIFCLLGCILVPIVVAYFVAWSMIYTAAQRLIVLENLTGYESLKQGFSLVRKRFVDFFVGYLVFLIPGCAWGFISCVVMLIPMVVFLAVLFIAIATGNALAMLVILIPTVISFVLFTALINSPFTTFGYTYWTKLVMEMRK